MGFKSRHEQKNLTPMYQTEVAVNMILQALVQAA